jgi:hypothetical protein
MPTLQLIPHVNGQPGLRNIDQVEIIIAEFRLLYFVIATNYVISVPRLTLQPAH